VSSPDVPGSQPVTVFVPRQRDRLDRWLSIVPEDVATGPPAGQPGHGSTAILRSQPPRSGDGPVQGRHNDVYEVICPSCGDRPDLDYGEVPPRLQQLRGPYSLKTGLAAFHAHQGLPWI
jgi:hypothetical protein